MIKITDSIKTIIDQNRELSFGFYHNLFNLSQLSRFLKPIVAAKTKKEISEKALLMALSRLQRSNKTNYSKSSDRFFVERVSINSDLYIATYQKNSENHQAVAMLYRKVQKTGGYMTISEGTHEITLIIDDSYIDHIKEVFSEKPIIEKKGVVSLGVKFDIRYLKVPGYLSKILQTLTLQSINIWELASTATELSLYISEEDTYLALETILTTFRQRRKN